MTADLGPYNFTLYKNADFSRLITYTDASGTPIDLTGYGASLKAKKNYASADVILSLSSGDGITLGGTAGTILIEIPKEDILPIEQDALVYSLILISGGIDMPFLGGTITISNEVL